MEPSYETVVDPSTMIFTLGAYLLHGVFAAAQVLVALYLLGTAARSLVAGAGDRLQSGLGLVAGVALIAPVVAGAPWLFSLCGFAIAIAAFVRSEPGGLRRAAIPALVITALFALWEREDPLALGVELVSNMQQVRSDEVDWQQAADRKAPKVGEFAPDFSLEDPGGHTQVRLSDFRGKRPVALMFGSYT
jgi:hypothetical protein